MASTTTQNLTIQTQDLSIDSGASVNRTFAQTITLSQTSFQGRFVVGSTNTVPIPFDGGAGGTSATTLMFYNNSTEFSVRVAFSQNMASFGGDANLAVLTVLPPQATLMIPGASYISQIELSPVSGSVTDFGTGQVYAPATGTSVALIDILAF